MLIFKIAISISIIALIIYLFVKFRGTSYFPKLMKRIDNMLIEDKRDAGIWSTQRFGYLQTLVLANICFWGSFIFLVIFTEKLPDIPETVVFLYFGAIGIPSYFKYKQREVEQDYPENLSEQQNEKHTKGNTD